MPKTCTLFARRFSFKVPCNWISPEKLVLFHSFFFFCFLFFSNSYFLLKEYDLTKRRSDTHLQVVYMGNIPISNWESAVKYGTSCLTTQSVAHQPILAASRSKAPGYKHSPLGQHIEGYCGGIIPGKVRVGFHVENCKGYDVEADAHTSWNAISRIIRIEEVEPPVSQKKKWLGNWLRLHFNGARKNTAYLD